MDIVAKNFRYDTPIVSRDQFEQHIKLYKNYIEKTNLITNQLSIDPDYSSANSIYSKYRALKESETFALNAVILHEAYFQNLGATKSKPSKCLVDLFTKYYGSYENWQNDFIACSKSARGWCVTAYEQRTNSLRNIMLDAHNVGVVNISFPILVLDMYEHAYFMDYATDKNKYIQYFIDYINWDVVEARTALISDIL